MPLKIDVFDKIDKAVLKFSKKEGKIPEIVILGISEKYAVEFSDCQCRLRYRIGKDNSITRAFKTNQGYAVNLHYKHKESQIKAGMNSLLNSL